MSELVRKFENFIKGIELRVFNKEALGGEIPFFISPYNTEHIEVVKSIELLRKKLESTVFLFLNWNRMIFHVKSLMRRLEWMNFFELKKDMDKSGIPGCNPISFGDSSHILNVIDFSKDYRKDANMSYF